MAVVAIDSISHLITPFLVENSFVPKAKNTFSRIEKSTSSLQTIALSSRAGRGSSSSTSYISATCSLYFKDLIAKEKLIIEDSFTGYPVLGGSIGKFKQEDPGHVSIPITAPEECEELAGIIMQNLMEGAFQLFDEFKNLHDVWAAIENKHPWLVDYHKYLDERNALRVASILCIVEGKSKAISWYKTWSEEQAIEDKEVYINAMNEKW